MIDRSPTQLLRMGEKSSLQMFRVIYPRAMPTGIIQFGLLVMYLYSAIGLHAASSLCVSSIMIVAGVLIRIHSSNKIRKLPVSVQSCKELEYAHDGAVLLTALGWGYIYASIFWEPVREYSSMLLISSGLAAAGTSTLIPNLNLVKRYLYLLLGLPLISMICFHPAEHITLILMTALYLFFLSSQSRLSCETLLDIMGRDEQYRQLFQNSFVGFVIHDKGRILEVNSATEMMFGRYGNSLVGVELKTLLHQEELREAALLFEPSQLNEIVGEVRCVREDGAELIIEYQGRRMRINGRAVRLTFLRDITARKVAERLAKEDIERSRDMILLREKAATEASRLKTEFLANMSHEIRTPLNAIVGISDLLSETTATPVQVSYYKTLKNSAEILMSLVNDILDFSKIDEGKLDLEITDFSILSLIDTQAEIVVGRARSAGIILETDLDPRLPDVVGGDFGRIGQIILNLLSNAVKFTAKDGHILLRVHVESEDADQAEIKFEVIDTGIGMNSAVIASLFRPFTQADNTMSRRFGGTGLGLSICKKLIELMKGDLGVQSQFGVGSTFWFTLKLPKRSAQTISEKFQKTEWSKSRVVICDQSNQTSNVLLKYFESWGIEASVVSRERLIESISYIGDQRKSPVVLASLATMQIHAEKLNGIPAVVLADSIVMLEESKATWTWPPHLQTVLRPIHQSNLYDAIVTALYPHQKQAAIQPETALASESVKEHNSNLRILVAEDNSTNQLLVLTLLRNLGYQAHAVGNGIEVLDTLNDSHFDAILMDCQMPDMNGYDAAAEIRRRGLGQDFRIPIIALTANATKDDQQRCFAAGMDDFLSKPLRKHLLSSVLEKWLSPGALAAAKQKRAG